MFILHYKGLSTSESFVRDIPNISVFITVESLTKVSKKLPSLGQNKFTGYCFLFSSYLHGGVTPFRLSREKLGLLSDSSTS